MDANKIITPHNLFDIYSTKRLYIVFLKEILEYTTIKVYGDRRP